MINVHDLTTSDVGRPVIYKSHVMTQRGFITAWNTKYIFVKYGYIFNPDDIRNTYNFGQATHPSDLHFVSSIRKRIEG